MSTKSNVEILPRPGSRIEGYLDAVESGQVFGWAWDRLNPADRLQIEVRVEGQVSAIAIADRARRDLVDGGIGDGAHAFVATLDEGTDQAVISAEAVSPATGERFALTLRAPVDESAVNAALLRKVATAVDALGHGQRRLGAALRDGRATTPPAVDTDRIARLLAEIRDAQTALSKQQAALEIFLLRFETMLRDRPDGAIPAARRTGWLDRIFK
jgi:hypothetical protein